MATTQLSNVIDVTVFRDMLAENDPTKTALYRSGIIAAGSLFNDLANSAGRKAELPFWRDLDHKLEPNYSDDSNTRAVPQNIVQDVMETRKAHMNQGWSVMDLTVELQSGQNAMRRIRNRVDAYWTYAWQNRLVAMSLGILNSNIAGNFAAQSPGTAGDMIIDVSTNTLAGVTAANLFSRGAFQNAVFTMGDRSEEISAMVVHSAVMKTMADQDDIDYIVDANGRTRIPIYQGRVVVVDDSCPVIFANGVDATEGFKYVSMLYGRSMFAYGMGSPNVPVEIWRDPQTGNGGGEEQLWTRKTQLLHPFGYTNNNLSATGNAGSQTLSDLRNATNWTRILTRKNVPMSFLVTNG